MIDIKFESHTRLELIQYAINKTNCKSYLEIGCDKNQIWDHIKVDTMFGVDPNRGGNMRMTSDEFFKKNTHTFDVIFVDGLHEYSQVTKDVDNSLKVLNDNGIIIIHDMLPRKLDMAMPDIICKGSWLGDVYRLAFDLANRKDILFRIGLIDQGCGVITKEANRNPSNFDLADWDYYVSNYQRLPLISYKELINTIK